MRAKTPSFIAEFPLRTTAADEIALSKRLDAARQIYNACLGEALRRLALMRQSKDWQHACKMPKTILDERSGKRIPNKERSGVFRKTQERFGFTPFAIQKFAQSCRDACSIGDHLGSHDMQTASRRAFRAVQQYAFGIRGRPRFKPSSRYRSVEGQGDAVIRFRKEPAPAIHWAGLVLPLRLDPKDKLGWQGIALEARTKYVRVNRRTIRGKTRWYAQLVQEGIAPQVRPVGEGVVGYDLGPSTVAFVSDTDASLEKLCPEVEHPWRETRRILRSMDRSRRATNPDNYDEKGCVKRGPKRWIRSERYKRRLREFSEIERKLAAARKTAHGNLANRILAQGKTIKGEKLCYRSFQRTWGRSVKVRAPGMWVERLRRKAESAGGGLIEIDPWKTRLSQFDHTTGQYVKKPLSLRMHVFGDGRTEPVQRDLYSAFLAKCSEKDFLDISQVRKAWPGAEPLLRRAMSRGKEPARREGLSQPRVKNVRAGRPSKGKMGSGCPRSRPGEAGDAVAQARAPESRISTPWNPLALAMGRFRVGCRIMRVGWFSGDAVASRGERAVRGAALALLLLMVFPLNYLALSLFWREELAPLSEDYRFPERAPYWRRFVAGFIDVPILFLLYTMAVSAAFPHGKAGWILCGVFPLVWLVYAALAEHRFGGTLGHYLLGLRVADLRTEKPPGLLLAFKRNAAKLLGLTAVIADSCGVAVVIRTDSS